MVSLGITAGMTTLNDKVNVAQAILRSSLTGSANDVPWIAWTGGKDSTVVLALWREVLAQEAPEQPVRALTVDTGVKFPQMIAYRERMAAEWGIELVTARPGVDPATYPFAADPVACCLELKVAPLARAMAEHHIATLITGVRADEHPERAKRTAVEQVEAPDMPAHTRINPILHFTEMDVWSYILGRGVPYCELYDEGYRSLGCVPCTAITPQPRGEGSERAGREATKEAQLGVLTGLGYF